MMSTEIGWVLSDSIKEKTLQLATEGILIDLDETSQKTGTVTLYSIGEHLDIDGILNNWQQMKRNASKVSQLDFHENVLTVLQHNPVS